MLSSYEQVKISVQDSEVGTNCVGIAGTDREIAGTLSIYGPMQKMRDRTSYDLRSRMQRSIRKHWEAHATR